MSTAARMGRTSDPDYATTGRAAFGRRNAPPAERRRELQAPSRAAIGDERAESNSTSVGRIARPQVVFGHAQESRRVMAGHVNRRRQVDSGKPHHVGHAGADRHGGSGQQLVLPGDHQPAVGEDFQFAKLRRIPARRQTGQARQVAHQDAALGRLGPHQALHDLGRQMMAVDDQAGHQPIFGHLIPDVIGVAAQHAVRAVAQVRAQLRAGVDGRADLRRIGRRVTDRHDHAAAARAADELDRSRDTRATA